MPPKKVTASALCRFLFLPENYCKFGNENSTHDFFMMHLCIENGEISIAIFRFWEPKQE